MVSDDRFAMETAGRPTDSDDPYYLSQGTVTHEIAHQWFGNLVTAKHAKDIWLHEGIAICLENVETDERTKSSLNDIVHSQYVIDGWGGKTDQFRKISLANPTPKFLLNTTPYFRGQAALHALRREVGDAKFWSALRSLANRPHGGTTDTAHVVNALERTTGHDLSDWAGTWLYSKGYQKLPDAPRHRTVVREIAYPLLDRASHWSKRQHQSLYQSMRKAISDNSPNNHLVIGRVRQTGSGARRTAYVEFRTKVSALYPREYRTCLTFRPNSPAARGGWLPITYTSNFKPNSFTTKPCPA